VLWDISGYEKFKGVNVKYTSGLSPKLMVQRDLITDENQGIAEVVVKYKSENGLRWSEKRFELSITFT
jgi:hypothetical protein